MIAAVTAVVVLSCWGAVRVIDVPAPKTITFSDSVPLTNPFDPFFAEGGEKVVEWRDGKYEIFPNGVERVTPYWGPITLALFPERKSCSQTIIVTGRVICWLHCHGDKVGAKYGSIEDLSTAAQHVLNVGRELTKDHWGQT